MQPTMAPLVDARANLRRAAIIATGIAVLGIVLTALASHPWAGVFGAVGLGLGGLNNRLLQRSVLRYGSDDSVTRKGFRRGVLTRLAAVTLLAIGCAVLVRPDGLAVFIGLALFHVIMLIGAALPVFRSLRPSA